MTQKENVVKGLPPKPSLWGGSYLANYKSCDVYIAKDKE